ncbi:MAG: DUF1538 domain-containing protein [Dehalococcoidales bacterium]|nr:DUF1538 domain-containing protein [Dehalococcoidales bacterium]
MITINLFETALVTAIDVAQAVIPLLLVLLIFQILFLRQPVSYVSALLKGTLIASLGLWLFLMGVQIGFLPYGRAVGEALGSLSHKWLTILLGFVLGFITTWSEPAVRILCDQVEEASAGSIRKKGILVSICTGVAVFVALGMARVIYHIPILYILIPGYILAIMLIWFTKAEFVGFAFDAGGVATGPMANTLLLGLGLGVAASSGGQTLLRDGFGLVALIALAPIISVMALGLIIRLKIHNWG